MIASRLPKEGRGHVRPTSFDREKWLASVLYAYKQKLSEKQDGPGDSIPHLEDLLRQVSPLVQGGISGPIHSVVKSGAYATIPRRG